ncbi:MAG: endonuclease III [Bacilli bacterium]|nr:endonuclease III [Bacilli bacterium]
MMIQKIIDYLDEIIINPRCELNYTKDYELLIAVMLSAQTTDKRVNEVNKILFSRYKSLKELKDANIEDIIIIIKSIGTFNKKAKNIKIIANSLLKDYNGIVPNNREYLESLPGVGRKTANVVLSELYNEQFIAVDTHIKRVSIRLGLANENDDVLIIEKKLTKKFKNYNAKRIHHQLLLFGRYYCKARNPLCDNCKLKDICKEKRISS